MKHQVRGILCITFFLLSSSLYAEERTIRVQGTAVVTATPDQATFSVGVETRHASAQQVVKNNNDLTQKIISVLKQESVEGKNIQTSDFSLRPLYNITKDGESPEVKAYVVSHRLNVRTDDITKVGSLMDKVSQAGANQFENITFGLRDEMPARQKARAAAVEDARQQAKVYAEAMGVALGRPLSLNAGQTYNQSASLRAMPLLAKQDGPSFVPIQSGELSFNATVDVTWEVLDLVK